MKNSKIQRRSWNVDREEYLRKARRRIERPDADAALWCVDKAGLILISGVDRLNLDAWTVKGYLKALPSRRQERRAWPLREAAVAVLLNMLRRFMQLSIAAKIAHSPEVLIAFRIATRPEVGGLIPLDRNGEFLTPPQIAVHFDPSGKIFIHKPLPAFDPDIYLKTLAKIPGSFLALGRELPCALTIDLESIAAYVCTMRVAIVRAEKNKQEK